MLWNANLDKSATKRQTKSELRADLKKWEEQRKIKKEKVTVDESHLVGR
jgi:E3 ubiquitin-protein ligase RAD18